MGKIQTRRDVRSETPVIGTTNKAANKKIVSRNKKIRANLEQMVADAEQVFSLYQKKCAEREEKRIYFDHYRLKLKKLQEKAAEKSNKPVTSTTYAFSSETKEH